MMMMNRFHFMHVGIKKIAIFGPYGLYMGLECIYNGEKGFLHGREPGNERGAWR